MPVPMRPRLTHVIAVANRPLRACPGTGRTLLQGQRVDDEGHDDGGDDGEEDAEEQDLAAGAVDASLEQEVFLPAGGVDGDIGPAFDGSRDGIGLGPWHESGDDSADGGPGQGGGERPVGVASEVWSYVVAGGSAGAGAAS